MQVGDLIPLGFDQPANLLGHAGIWRPIEQDTAGVAQQAKQPVGDDKRADEAGQRVHPGLAERTRQEKADNDQHGHRSVGQNVNDRGTHVVVAVVDTVRVTMIMLFECQLALTAWSACARRTLAGRLAAPESRRTPQIAAAGLET